MTQERSYFDLLRDDLLRRLWVPAISIIFFAFYFVITLLLTADQYLGSSYLMSESEKELAKRMIYRAFTSLNETGGDVIFLLGILAMLSAFTAFSRLHDQRKTDFWHSLPVSRGHLYLVNVTGSLISVILPYFFFALISAVIAGAKTGQTGCMAYALSAFALNSGFFLLLFASFSLAMLLTGVTLAGVAMMLLICFWGPFTVLIIKSLMVNFFSTFYYLSEVWDTLTEFSSPAFWSSGGLGGLSIGLRSLGAYAAGVCILIITCKLYLMRPSERAGRPLVFGILRPFLKLIIMIPAALGAALMFVTMSGDASDFWSIFAIVCVILILHMAAEIIYALDLKSFGKHAAEIPVLLILCFALFSVFRLDLIGYDSYLPDENKVSSAGIYSYALDGIYLDDRSVDLTDNGYGLRLVRDYPDDRDIVDRMELSDTSALMKIAEAGIASSGDIVTEGYVRQILIGWHLTGGRSVYRQYFIDLGLIADELAKVYENGDYKSGVYPLIGRFEGDEGGDLSAVCMNDALGLHETDIEGDEAQKLYETYISELMALDMDTRKHEMPICSLQFRGSKMEEIAETVKNDPDYGYLIYQLENVALYPVYPSFAETLGLLSAQGVVINEGIDAGQIAYVTIDYYGYDGGIDLYGDAQKGEVTLTDPEEITQILEHACFTYAAENELCPIYYDMEVTLHFESAQAQLHMNFTYESVPDFVLGYFGVSRESVNEGLRESSWGAVFA